jgi:hypothetical protein
LQLEGIIVYVITLCLLINLIFLNTKLHLLKILYYDFSSTYCKTTNEKIKLRKQRIKELLKIKDNEFLYNCISVPYAFNDSEIIWDKSSSKNKFALCLVKVAFDDFLDNDLYDHLTYLKDQGHNARTIICRYLLSAYDKKQYDYFKTWIELIE